MADANYTAQEKLRKCKEYLKDNAVYVRCPLVDEGGNLTGEYNYRLYVSFETRDADIALENEQLVEAAISRYAHTRRPFLARPRTEEDAADQLAPVIVYVLGKDMGVDQFERDYRSSIPLIIEPSVEEMRLYLDDMKTLRKKALALTHGRTFISATEAAALKEKLPKIEEHFSYSPDYIDVSSHRRLTVKDIERDNPDIGRILENYSTRQGMDWDDVAEILKLHGIDAAVTIDDPHTMANGLADSETLHQDVARASFHGKGSTRFNLITQAQEITH